MMLSISEQRAGTPTTKKERLNLKYGNNINLEY